jgi:hypothetical protein
VKQLQQQGRRRCLLLLEHIRTVRLAVTAACDDEQVDELEQAHLWLLSFRMPAFALFD